MSVFLDDVLKRIGPLSKEAMQAAAERQGKLTKPAGSLGRLEELSIKLAGMKGDPAPIIERKAVITIAADHGVAAESVSLYPQSVTRQMVLNFLRGGAAINVLAQQSGARVVVVDMGILEALPPMPGLISRRIGSGTRSMTKGPAMTTEQAEEAIETGVKILEMEIGKGLDMVGTGDMGIGNTTASSAVCSVFTGQPLKKVVGRGTGIGDKQLAYKIDTIKRALLINKPSAMEPLCVLAKVGGFEIGGLAGVMLGAAAHRIPVVIDGFVSGAAALIAAGLSPRAKDYMIAAHVSAEPGHKIMLDFLGLRPLLDLNMRLGEGTGAALAMHLADAAVKTLTGMATFDDAGVSGPKVLPGDTSPKGK